MSLLTTRLAIMGGAIAASLSASLPAAAYVNCPPGFYYSYGYGCVPLSAAYNNMYGDDYGYGPPVYDTYGLAFGFSGGRSFHSGGTQGGGGGHGGVSHAGGGGGGHAGGGGHGGGGRH